MGIKFKVTPWPARNRVRDYRVPPAVSPIRVAEEAGPREAQAWAEGMGSGC
jgi:hypothetical protein